MQKFKLQHEHLGQWEEIHFKEVFISGNVMMKSIVLTLLPIGFIVLKNSSPLDLASI
jgi:hypothetical protein